VLYGAEDTIERVYFPHTGVISLVVGLTTGQFVEAGMLGRNSVIGAAAPLSRLTSRTSFCACYAVGPVDRQCLWRH